MARVVGAGFGSWDHSLEPVGDLEWCSPVHKSAEEGEEEWYSSVGKVVVTEEQAVDEESIVAFPMECYFEAVLVILVEDNQHRLMAMVSLP